MHVIFRLMLVIMMLLSAQFVNADSDGAQGKMSENAAPAALPPAYPDWPQRPIHMDIVPSPPPGPYMSTGLSDAPRGFGCCKKRERKMADSQSFTQMPWPERRRPPHQWLPENGEYSYAPEDDYRDSRPPRSGYRGQEMWQPPMYGPPPQNRRYW